MCGCISVAEDPTAAKRQRLELWFGHNLERLTLTTPSSSPVDRSEGIRHLMRLIGALGVTYNVSIRDLWNTAWLGKKLTHAPLLESRRSRWRYQ
jgi:hypothetical protein